MLSLFQIKYSPNKNNNRPIINLINFFYFEIKMEITNLPWPMSPNITPNKNGKVIIVKIPGFIS